MIASATDVLRQTLLAIRRTPHHAVGIAVILGTGVGIALAAASLAHSVLRAPLPYPESEGLMRVWDSSPDEHGVVPFGVLTDRQYQTLRSAEGPFQLLAIYRSVESEVAYAGWSEARVLDGALTSTDLFSIMQPRVVAGRTFEEADERISSTPAVIVSERIARTDGLELGHILELDGVDYRIVGVVGGMTFPHAETAFWLPVLSLESEPGGSLVRTGTTRFFEAIGRLRRGLAPEAAAERATALVSEKDSPSQVSVRRLRDLIVNDARQPLLILRFVAISLLGVALLDAAWLFAWHQELRGTRHDTAHMLGASRGRIIFEIGCEVGMIGAASAVAAVAIVWALLEIASRQPSEVIPRAAETGMTLQVALLTFASASVLVVLAAIPGMLSTTRRLVLRPAPSARPRKAWQVSAAALQIGIVTCVAVQATLSSLVMHQLLFERLGLNRTDLIAIEFVPPGGGAVDPETRAQLYEEIVRVLVASGTPAAVTNTLPLSGSWHATEAATMSVRGELRGMVEARLVTRGYFAIVGLEVSASGTADGRDGPSAIVDETLARSFFGSTNLPPDARLQVGAAPNTFPVRGLVPTVRHRDLLAAPTPTVYLWFEDATLAGPVASKRSFYVLAPTTDGVIDKVVDVVGAISPGTSAREIIDFNRLLWTSAGARPVAALFASSMAVVAMLFMALGLFGSLSRTVRARQRETAIRGALGATPIRLLLKNGESLLTATGCGLLLGAVLSLASERLIRSVLHLPEGFSLPPMPIIMGVALSLVIVPIAIASLPLLWSSLDLRFDSLHRADSTP